MHCNNVSIGSSRRSCTPSDTPGQKRIRTAYTFGSRPPCMRPCHCILASRSASSRRRTRRSCIHRPDRHCWQSGRRPRQPRSLSCLRNTPGTYPCTHCCSKRRRRSCRCRIRCCSGIALLEVSWTRMTSSNSNYPPSSRDPRRRCPRMRSSCTGRACTKSASLPYTSPSRCMSSSGSASSN
jgi:hypothetical protein